MHINATNSKLTKEMHDVYHLLLFVSEISTVFLLTQRKTPQNNKGLKSRDYALMLVFISSYRAFADRHV